jgi:hypothetical protein
MPSDSALGQDMVVPGVAIGPLLAPDDRYAAEAFISFRIRQDVAARKLIGPAFDFTFELA